MRVRTKNPGGDHCIASGCSGRGDIALGPDTILGRKHQIKDDFGVCDYHWGKHCAEQEKLEEKEALVEVDKFQIPEKRRRTPVLRR